MTHYLILRPRRAGFNENVTNLKTAGARFVKDAGVWLLELDRFYDELKGFADLAGEVDREERIQSDEDALSAVRAYRPAPDGIKISELEVADLCRGFLDGVGTAFEVKDGHSLEKPNKGPAKGMRQLGWRLGYELCMKDEIRASKMSLRDSEVLAYAFSGEGLFAAGGKK